MPRFSQIGCLILLCITQVVIAQDGRHPGLEKKINLNFTAQKIDQVLEDISLKTALYFSYDPMVFNAKEIVTVTYLKQKTETILDDLFKQKYSYTVLKNQVIITKFEEQADLDFEAPEPEKQYQLISGHIQDASNKKIIPYGSVSILGKAFGTISNIDGDFELKIPNEYLTDTLFVSCMGYSQYFVELDTLTASELDVRLIPIDVRLKEIQVTAADPLEIIDGMMKNIRYNYPRENKLMTAFYREVLKQDDEYVNISEAVLDILKASYSLTSRDDRIRVLKGRKSPEVSTFKFVDFKMQGGPYYITKLDVIKTMDTFLDPEYRNLYGYEMERLIDYLGRPTYVIKFSPLEKLDYLSYQGRLYIDKATSALAHAEFELSRDGKKYARKALIRKKPKSYKVRPLVLAYKVSYKRTQGKWNLSSAQTSVKFRIRSKKDKVNAVFHSVSDMLITKHEQTDIKRFDREETFSSRDIFTDMILEYDHEFWGKFNIIKPTEDLEKALEGINFQKRADIKPTIKPSKFLTKKSKKK